MGVSQPEGFPTVRADKMKVAVVLLLVVAAMAATDAAPKRINKRIFWSDIVHVVDNIGHFFSDAYNAAKDAVKNLAAGLDFDKAVDALVPMIHSGMTVTACTATCTAGAATVLGPFATLSATVCGPICEGALEKLEHAAG